jgi:hypothetical protein
LVTSLRTHYLTVRELITTTVDDSLRRRLMTSAGEAEALAGWTLFDLQRPREALRLYRSAVESAREAGDGPPAACVLGFWSYLLSAQGDVSGSARMLAEATAQVQGSAATTQSWVSARLGSRNKIRYPNRDITKAPDLRRY